MERNRIFNQQYELARMFVPVKDAEFIMSHCDELANGRGREVYEELQKHKNDKRSYMEDYDYQFVKDIFWLLSNKTPVYVCRYGYKTVMAAPTDWAERERWPRKERECVELGLRVHIKAYQEDTVRQMMAIAARKMRNYEADFYFHDMLWLAPELCRKPILWIVGRSHTFHEVLDRDGDAKCWAEYPDTDRTRAFIYGGKDDTWTGAALRVCCGEDDDYYFHDGERLMKVGREHFKAIHDRYVESVRIAAADMMDNRRKAA